MHFKDEETAAEAVRKAIELGVNYFDVGPGYGGGKAEAFLAQGIKGLTDKIIVTAKSCPGGGGVGLGEYRPETGFGIRTADQARRRIERSMNILGVDHLDMYQFWACHSSVVFDEGLKSGGFMEGVLKAKEEGLFDYIGITTHGDSNEIIHYLKDTPYEFDMVTIPFSVENYKERIEALAYCADRGIGVIAMNPLAGGTLGRSVPALTSIATHVGCESMVEAALRFVAYYPGVTTALNGITFADHAIQGAEAVERGPLSETESKALAERFADLFKNVEFKYWCTACGYCGQCTVGIEIPEVLEIYTGLLVPSMADTMRRRLQEARIKNAEGYDPSACTACKECESKCPNSLPVAQLMAKATEIWPS